MTTPPKQDTISFPPPNDNMQKMDNGLHDDRQQEEWVKNMVKDAAEQQFARQDGRIAIQNMDNDNKSSHHGTFRNGSKSNNNNANNDESPFWMYKDAFMEIPMQLTTTNGLQFESSSLVNISMKYTIPPFSKDGKLSGLVQANNYTNTSSIDFEYITSKYNNISLGLIHDSKHENPSIMFGANTFINDTKTTLVGCKIGVMNQSIHSFYVRHKLNPQWILEARCLPPNEQQLVIPTLTFFNKTKSFLASFVMNESGSPLATIDIYPKLSSFRRLHVYGKYQHSLLHFGISLKQYLHSHLASISTGLCIVSNGCLQWVLSWHRGDATIRIPISLTTVGATTLSTSIGQTLYITLYSYFVQEVIAEIWGWKNKKGENDNDTSDDVITQQHHQDSKKSKDDAILQIQLMTRQAKRKMRLEQQSNGLIIIKATYSNTIEYWDCTIPLQFWVTNSTLKLPPSVPKSALLGFYTLSQKMDNKNGKVSNSTSLNKSSLLSSNSWWNEMCMDLWGIESNQNGNNTSMHKNNNNPELHIQYEYRGKSFEITVQDKEGLILPLAAREKMK